MLTYTKHVIAKQHTRNVENGTRVDAPMVGMYLSSELPETIKFTERNVSLSAKAVVYHFNFTQSHQRETEWAVNMTKAYSTLTLGKVGFDGWWGPAPSGLVDIIMMTAFRRSSSARAARRFPRSRYKWLSPSRRSTGRRLCTTHTAVDLRGNSTMDPATYYRLYGCSSVVSLKCSAQSV